MPSLNSSRLCQAVVSEVEAAPSMFPDALEMVIVVTPLSARFTTIRLPFMEDAEGIVTVYGPLVHLMM